MNMYGRTHTYGNFVSARPYWKCPTRTLRNHLQPLKGRGMMWSPLIRDIGFAQFITQMEEILIACAADCARLNACPYSGGRNLPPQAGLQY